MLTGPHPDDAGVSLIELVVGMAVSMIVLTMAAVFFVNTIRASDASTTDSADTTQANVALGSWSALLRTADYSPNGQRIVGITSTAATADLTFYTDLDSPSGTGTRGAPWLVHLSMTADGRLVELRYQPTGTTYPSSPTVSTTIASCTVACITAGAGTTPGFVAYYPPSGCAAASLAANGLCTTDPSSPASPSDAVDIAITFTMTDPHAKTSRTFATLASVGVAS